jgi:dTDP-4-dehydrorhamnose reductase
MRIVVIGSNGQLGTEAVIAFANRGHDVLGLTHRDIELCDESSLRERILPLRPEVIVNTAAMHHVENCERDPHLAFAVNALACRHLAALCRELNAKLMHVSTDYVFDGAQRNPYTENDTPLPLNVYGSSKLAGEHFVRAGTERHFVLRTSAIYGCHPCRAKGGLNFVELMLKLARERAEVRVVAAEYISPTPASELALQMAVLAETEHYGLYHATAEGHCSWHEFAAEIFALSSTKVALKTAGPHEFPAKVPRPPYSVLENANLKRLGLNVFTSWQTGLRNYLARRSRPVDSVRLPATNAYSHAS